MWMSDVFKTMLAQTSMLFVKVQRSSEHSTVHLGVVELEALKLSEVLKEGQAAAHSPQPKIREVSQRAEDGRVSRRDIDPVS